MRPAVCLASLGCAQAVLAPASLDCSSSIDALDEAPVDFTVLADAIALDLGGHDVTASAESDPRARLHAKTGLVVRTGAAAEIVVPTELRDVASIEWGSAGRTWDLTVPACEGDAVWLAFAGGVFVDEARCVELVVNAGGQEEAASMAVGAACGS